MIAIILNELDDMRVDTILNNFRMHNQQYLTLDFKDVYLPIKRDEVIDINYFDDASSSSSEIQFGVDVVYQRFKTWDDGDDL